MCSILLSDLSMRLCWHGMAKRVTLLFRKPGYVEHRLNTSNKKIYIRNHKMMTHITHHTTHIIQHTSRQTSYRYSSLISSASESDQHENSSCFPTNRTRLPFRRTWAHPSSKVGGSHLFLISLVECYCWSLCFFVPGYIV